MDIQRTDKPVRRRKRWLMIGTALVGLIGLSGMVASLGPAVPAVPRSSLWIDTVKQGDMLRQVRGIGSLVPEEIAWISARTEGRVDRILLRPGATVAATDVILELTNPQVRQAAADAQLQLKAAEAELVNLRAQLESGLLAAEATVAGAEADYRQAKLKAEVNDRLFNKGLVSQLELNLSTVTAQQAQSRSEIERKRLEYARRAIAPQLAVKQAEVDRIRAQAELREEDLEALTVRAGMNGVLQSLPAEIGAQMAPGTNLARVANPTRLKAAVRVPETQAKDIQIGQSAAIDTRSGVVAGRVSRIDPSVQNGTVMVDVTLEDALPRGARPDLSVEGTIELERLDNVTFVGRPAVGQENGSVTMFKMEADGTHAVRVPVQLGRMSASTAEIVKGLQSGDAVILSDTSQWSQSDRIRIN